MNLSVFTGVKSPGPISNLPDLVAKDAFPFFSSPFSFLYRALIDVSARDSGYTSVLFYLVLFSRGSRNGTRLVKYSIRQFSLLAFCVPRLKSSLVQRPGQSFERGRRRVFQLTITFRCSAFSSTRPGRSRDTPAPICRRERERAGELDEKNR